MNGFKRKKLSHQIIINTVIALTMVFLIGGVSLTLFTFDKFTSFAGTAFDTIGTALQKNVAVFSVEDLFVKKDLVTDEYNRLVEDIDAFHKNISVISDKLLIVTEYNDEYVYLYGHDKNKKYAIGDQVTDMSEALEKVLETGQGHRSDFSFIGMIKSDALDFYVPIKDENGSLIVVHTTVKSQLVWIMFGALIGSQITVLLLVLFVVNFIVGLVIKKEMKQMDELVKRVEDISNLEGDLTKRISVKTNNEIGLMAEHINHLLETIHYIMKTIASTSIVLSQGTHEWSSLMSSAENQTVQIQKSVDENRKGIQQRGVSTEAVNQSIAQINDSVIQVAANMQAVSIVADRTSQEAEESRVIMGNMKSFVLESVAQVSDTGDKVDALKRQSEQISTVVESIHKIATQTNLLALNASIEAARAGEQGRGFSVVANEVKTLAEESAQQAGSIEKLIHSIQNQIDETQKSMNRTLTIIDQEAEMADVLEKRYVSIALAVSSLAEKVEVVNRSTEAITGNSQGVAKEMERLSKYFSVSDDAIVKMMQQVMSQNDNIQGLANETKQLTEISETLHQMIKRLTL